MAESQISSWLPVIDDSLRRVLSERLTPARLLEAANYCVFSGGKRIRPLFVMSLGFELGVESGKIIGPASAIELLHTASLIHDDLPALDNDDFRRGRPSCHKQFDEATAVLLGDALCGLAQEVATRVSLEPRAGLAVANEVARAFTDLCIGQQLDMIPHPGEDQIVAVYRHKTGALFRAAAVIPALAAGESHEFVELSRTFGESIGIEFQLRDDLLDGSEQKGRPAGSDKRNEKDTAQRRGITERLLARFQQSRGSAISRMEQLRGPLPMTRALVAGALGE